MKKQSAGLLLLSFLLAAMLCCPLAQAEQGKDGAILIVAFGTSIEKAKVSYANVEKQVKAQYPDREVRWAWTAHSLLKAREGQRPMLSVQEALAALATEGVKSVDILSLHVIPGQEYHNLVQTARAFEGLPKGLERVGVSPPLLHDTESVKTVAGLLLQTLPKTRKAGEAVIFVGHGTHHAAGVYYPALQYYFSKQDKNALVGTVEGDLELDGILEILKAGSVKKVWLAPLMMVAGDHAGNDLFGAEGDSWKSRLEAKGINVESLAKGLGEYPPLVEQWVKGLSPKSQ